MKKIIVLSLIIFPLFLIGIGLPDFHQVDNTISPYTSAIGGTQVTNYADPFSYFYNPAMLGALKSGSFGLSYKMRVTDGADSENFSAQKILSKGKFSGLALQMPKGAIHYTPLVDTHAKDYEKLGGSYARHSYLDYELNSMGFSASHNTTYLHYGLTLKYIYGRQIYNEEIKDIEDDAIISTDFYDRKVKGYTTDFGFYYKNGSVSSGLVFYDLISKLYWDGRSDQHLTQRMGFGASFGTEIMKVHSAITKKLKWNSKSTFHLGYEQRYIIYGSQIDGIIIRLGTYSDNFTNKDKIGITTGFSIPFQVYAFEFSWKTLGFEGKYSEFFFGFKMGFDAQTEDR